MNTRVLLLVSATLLTVATSTVFPADFEVPPGIAYKTVDEATDSKARQAVKDAFSIGAPQVLVILSDAVVCGPAYWSMIKEDSSIRASKTIPSNFRVPNTTTGKIQALEGAMFKDAEAKRAMAGRLAVDVGKEPSIRKLNQDELRLYWAMIPFDIEEPLYILESNNKRFLLHLIHNKQQFLVMWVDELSSYTLRK